LAAVSLKVCQPLPATIFPGRPETAMLSWESGSARSSLQGVGVAVGSALFVGVGAVAEEVGLSVGVEDVVAEEVAVADSPPAGGVAVLLLVSVGEPVGDWVAVVSVAVAEGDDDSSANAAGADSSASGAMAAVAAAAARARRSFMKTSKSQGAPRRRGTSWGRPPRVGRGCGP
jgi:hypothetical protein